MEYFVLKDAQPLKKDQPFHCVMGLKDEMMYDCVPLQPTPVSITNRHLEWVIEDTKHNRSHIAKHYHHMSVLDQGEEENVAVPVAVEAKPEAPAAPIKAKVSPLERRRLKSELSEKLKAKGIAIPNGATLEILMELYAKS